VSALFPVLLAVHVALAVALLLPSIALPFLLRGNAAGAASLGAATRFLLRLQSSGSVVIGLGLAVTGTGLLLILGVELLGRPWLMVALALYAANLLVAAFIARPNLRRLVGLSEGDPELWRRRARQQRWVAYGMAAVTGVIGLLMMAKPELW
jgi:hypothetical protein